MPLYGRSFMNTKGIGQPYNGVGEGTWEQGVYDYKALPRPGAEYIEDLNAIGTYTYDSSNKELISFDSPKTVSKKVDYVKNKKMGGVMWWESSADKKQTGHALIPFAASKLGTLDSTQNHLRFVISIHSFTRHHLDLFFSNDHDHHHRQMNRSAA